MKSQETRTMLLTQRPLRLFFTMSLPSMAGMMIVSLYSFMDGVYVGQMVDSTAMAAVSVSFTFTLLNTGTAALIGIGSASVLSRAIGRDDREAVNKIMNNMLLMNLVASSVLTMIGVLFIRQLLQISGAAGELLDNAERYLRIFFLGSVFMNFSNSGNQIIRGEGQIKKAMLLMAFGAVINIVLDPVFILILRPYGMGIEAVALATVLAHFLQACATFRYFRRCSPLLKISRARLERSICPEVVSIGISAMLLQVLILVQRTVMYKTSARFATPVWHILLGATLSIQAFVYELLWGLSQGFQPAAGTNYGAGEHRRLQRITGVFSAGATALAFLLFLPLQLFPGHILRFFIQEQEVVEIGIPYLRLFFSTFILFGVLLISISLFQSMGKVKLAILLASLRQVLLYVPTAVLLPLRMGISGVWLAPVVTDLLVFVVAIAVVIRSFRAMKC